MSVTLVTLCVAVAMIGIALETQARKQRPVPVRRERSTEEQRWVAVLTVPLAGGAVSVAAALATESNWFFLGAVLLVPAWIGSLAYLALSSDVNGKGGDRA